MRRAIATLLCGCAVVGLLTAETAWAQDGHGSIVGWGDQIVGGDLSSGFVAVAAGDHHSLGLKDDGSIVAWGDNLAGQCDVPEPNTDFVAIAGGGTHTLGLKADGTIVAWGANSYGQCDAPAPNTGFVAIAAGDSHNLGLKGYPRGDLNCDGLINGFDIDGFVLALQGPDYYDPVYPDCERMNADINADGVVNGFDIDAFVELIIED
ncbi:MAG: hypothetical protein KKB50_10410 [Planctomycetes bacterium]|nr:hypothetical protein [Planctomycetota bacterium]